MRLAVRRASICLVPPQQMERVWVARQLDEPEIWPLFGLHGPGGADFLLACRSRPVILGMIRRHPSWERVGFVAVFPPHAHLADWEFAYAIPEHRHRDAFSAIHALDAMCHYAFDHLELPAMVGRTRLDNAAACAILRRVGYRPVGRQQLVGEPFHVVRVDQAGWAARRDRLHRTHGPAAFSTQDPASVPRGAHRSFCFAGQVAVPFSSAEQTVATTRGSQDEDG